MPSLMPQQRVRSEINVTPLVDVVLVLLIVFMLVVPLTQSGIAVRLATPSRTHHLDPSNAPVAVRADLDGRIFVDREEVPAADLEARLRVLLAGRETRLATVDAAGELPYAAVSELFDAVHASGVQSIGVVLGQPHRDEREDTLVN